MSQDQARDLNTTKSSERSDFALRIQYKNTLPDLCYDTKSISTSMGLQEATAYRQTSLERDYHYELNFEDDVLIDVDLVNTDAYKVQNKTDLMNTTDLLLMKDETNFEKVQGISKKSDVSWLRRSDLFRVGSSSHKPPSLIERTIVPDSKLSSFKKKYKTRDEQIEAINKTFADAKIPVTKHYESADLIPVATHYIFPDEKYWKHTISLITFDAPPSNHGTSDPLSRDQIQNSLLRGMSDKQGQYVGYFTQDDSLSFQNNPSTTYYRLVREYNWTIRNAVAGIKEDVYVWRFDPKGGVYYNDISAKVQMAKRRLTAGKTLKNYQSTVLNVSNRDPTAEELENQDDKTEILRPLKNDSSEITQKPSHTED